MDEPTVVVEMATDVRPALATVEGILTKLRLNLEDIDRLATERNTPRVVWGVDELSYENAIRVVLAPRSLRHSRPVQSVAQTAGSLVSGVQALGREAKIPDYFNVQMLGRIEDVSIMGAKGGIRSVTVESRNGVAHRGNINADTQKNAASAVIPAIDMISSVTGILDVINLRQRRPRAQIYNPASKQAVDVIGRPEGAELLKEHLGRYVVVAGLLSRNKAGQPVRIGMDDLVALPDMSQEITADDLYGSDPNVTGGKSVADYVDWLRSDR